jgi:iron complex outermembrane recepter protein
MFMKKTNKFIMFLAAFMLLANLMIAQSGIKGVIQNSQTKETLIGTNIVVKGTTLGTVSDLNGEFSLRLDPGSHIIVLSYTGYETIEMAIAVSAGQFTDLGRIRMEASAIGLAGASIIADRARERETPVAFSNLNKQDLEQLLGSRDIPLAMNITPNVYSTMQGGGAGDARINVRGFNQRNVAIMINGVPVNDMENGWVYWSNWDGVGDATSSIQMQRGLSAVNLATPSVGGTMNVITSPSEQNAGLMYKQEFGSGNFIKSTIMAHSGLIDGKWAFSAGGVRKTGEGVIDKTWTDAGAYYFAASYNLNSKNRLELYAMGAPQRHGQNLYKQNIAAYDHEYAKSFDEWPQGALDKFPESQSGRYYNENWGSVHHSYTGKQSWNGKESDRYNPHFINERENYYHKPLANLNWYSQFSDDVSLFTTAYYSGGKGGGTGTYGSMKWDYSGPSRMVDFDATIANNSVSDTARGVLRNSINNQWTLGVISKLRWNISEKVKTSFGIDARTAEIAHFREVRDLLGGKFYYFTGNEFESGSDYNKGLGDIFDYNFTNNVDWIGGFGQAEYNYGNVTFYGMAGYSMIKYRYTNHFLKAPGTNDELKSETDWIAGYQAKGGFSYRFTETLSAFLNVGYVSKVPIFDAVINDRDATVADDPENEKFTSFELGTSHKSRNNKLYLTGNVYYTTWNDRTRNLGVILEDGSEGFVFITGMSQTHYGFELEGEYRPISLVGINFAGSINNWYYTDNVSGTYKDYADPDSEQEYNYFVKDLKVGDAPQLQFVMGLSLYPFKGLRAQLLGKYYGNHYADWDPFSRTDIADIDQVWKTPAYTVFDLHASYDIPLNTSEVGVQVFCHVFNLFNDIYIQDATDNSRFNAYYGDDNQYSHKPWTAEVFLGLPRTVNFGMRINL